jgi:hypothetical protein
MYAGGAIMRFLDWLIDFKESDDGLPPLRWRQKAEQGYKNILAGRRECRVHAAHAILALLDAQPAGNWRLFRGWADPDEGRLWEAGFRDRLPFEIRPDVSMLNTAKRINHPQTGKPITLDECFMILYETIKLDGGDTRPLWRRDGGEWPITEATYKETKHVVCYL